MTGKEVVSLADQEGEDSGRSSFSKFSIPAYFEMGFYIVLLIFEAFRYSINTTDCLWRRLMILLVFSLLSILGLYDRKTGRIPDVLNGIILSAGFADWLFFQILNPEKLTMGASQGIGGVQWAGEAAAAMPGLADRIIGFFCVSLILFLISWMSGGGIGGGDIKLMAAAGFLCGMQKIIGAGIIGFYIGGVYAILLLLFKKRSGKARFPLGPFLCLGIGWMLGS